MESPSRKLIPAVVVVSGVVLTVAAGLAFRRPLLERWYLWQVESGQGEEKDAALARLEEIGSVGAIPFVLELALGARVSESTSGGFFRADYDGSDLLEDFSTPLNFAVRETFVDLICEIVPTEGDRPGSGHTPVLGSIEAEANPGTCYPSGRVLGLPGRQTASKEPRNPGNHNRSLSSWS